MFSKNTFYIIKNVFDNVLKKKREYVFTVNGDHNNNPRVEGAVRNKPMICFLGPAMNPQSFLQRGPQMVSSKRKKKCCKCYSACLLHHLLSSAARYRRQKRERKQHEDLGKIISSWLAYISTVIFKMFKLLLLTSSNFSSPWSFITWLLKFR